MFIGQVLEILHVLLERGVVHQHVQMAKLLDGPFNSFLAKISVSHVPRNSDALPAFVLDRSLRLFRVFVFVQIGDRHIRTLPCEQNSHGAADARIASGDQRYFPFELFRTLVMRRVVHRREFQDPPQRPAFS